MDCIKKIFQRIIEITTIDEVKEVINYHYDTMQLIKGCLETDYISVDTATMLENDAINSFEKTIVKNCKIKG